MTEHVNEAEVRAKVAGRKAAEEFLTMILEESHGISGKHGPEAGAAFLMALAHDLHCILPEQPAEAKGPAKTADDPAWVSAIKHCDEIVADCAEVLDGEGAAFAASVSETAEGIRSTIMRTKRVTLAQSEALQNMHTGVLRWHGTTS